MGYVPPIRDDQQFQYGNRYVYKKEGIRPMSPVEEIRFLKVMSENPGGKQHKYQGKDQHSYERPFVSERMFGKGEYFDQMV
ncbi:MAG: hypothetical protein LRY71_12645 [Bacillaceae bacterium]|nr:hypothetical protein [Bacillaceae bacterium]